MQAVLTTPVLAAGERVFDGTDLVLLGLLDGTWTALRAELAEPEASEAQAGAAVVALRRAHKLYAAEDMRKWLDARGLTLAAVRTAFRRGSSAPGPDLLCAAAFAFGTFSALREGLAQRVAAAELQAGEPAGSIDPSTAGLELGDTRERIARLLALEGSFRALRATIDADQPQLTRRLVGHGLDWVEVRWEGLTLTREDVALEAALCVREDGMTLAATAAESGGVLTQEQGTLGGLTPQVRAVLVSAAPGELVGPAREEDAWVLRRVTHRSSPSLEDPDVRARLVDEALADRVAPLLARQRLLAEL